MEQKEPCFQCGEPVNERIYAVYWSKDIPEKDISKDDVAGFLCDSCRGKNKVKGLKSRNEWNKLEELKKTLSK